MDGQTKCSPTVRNRDRASLDACLNDLRRLLTDNVKYFYGMSYSEKCPENARTGIDCFTFIPVPPHRYVTDQSSVSCLPCPSKHDECIHVCTELFASVFERMPEQSFWHAWLRMWTFVLLVNKLLCVLVGCFVLLITEFYFVNALTRKCFVNVQWKFALSLQYHGQNVTERGWANAGCQHWSVAWGQLQRTCWYTKQFVFFEVLCGTCIFEHTKNHFKRFTNCPRQWEFVPENDFIFWTRRSSERAVAARLHWKCGRLAWVCKVQWRDVSWLRSFSKKEKIITTKDSLFLYGLCLPLGSKNFFSKIVRNDSLIAFDWCLTVFKKEHCDSIKRRAFWYPISCLCRKIYRLWLPAHGHWKQAVVSRSTGEQCGRSLGDANDSRNLLVNQWRPAWTTVHVALPRRWNWSDTFSLDEHWRKWIVNGDGKQWRRVYQTQFSRSMPLYYYFSSRWILDVFFFVLWSDIKPSEQWSILHHHVTRSKIERGIAWQVHFCLMSLHCR